MDKNLIQDHLPSLIEQFSIIEDPRLDRKKQYPLLNVLVFTFVSILSDQQSWYEIEAFSLSNLDWFKEFIDISTGVPSHDTFRRVFSLLEPSSLEKLVIDWANSIRERQGACSSRVVALDGKALKGVPWKLSEEKLYTLNAWDTKAGHFIGQLTIGEKTNEISAAPKLLNNLNLNKTIVTADALLTQREIAKTIVSKGGDYVLAVKGNQNRLYEDVCLYFTDPKHILDRAQSVEKNRGVVEVRSCQKTSSDWFSDHFKWMGLSCFYAIESECSRGEELKKQTRYYMSSLDVSAQEMLKIVRSHWSIENVLHRTLDVIFREDASQEHNRNAASNLSIMRKIALSLLKAIEPSKKLKLKVKEAAYSPEFRARCLRGTF